jgi:YYY domain-containing protein
MCQGSPVREAVLFWLATALVGLLAVPAAEVLFPRLPGRGLAFARPLGLLLVAYPVWLLASLDIVPYGDWSPLLGIGLLAVLALVLLRRRLVPARANPTTRPRETDDSRGTPRESSASGGRVVAFRMWLAAEIVFTVAFAGWTVLRSFAPDIRATEKPMDMAIVNAIGRSGSFPPLDPWLSGERLNYYYLGHYLVAFLVRTTGADPAVAYNVAVALFFALTASAVFALTATLVLAGRPTRPGAALCGGGAAAVVAMILGAPAGALQLLRAGTSDYDWWTPSRVVDGAATEFPFFSYLLGDLHAHVMATPFALLAAAVAVQVALSGPRLRAGEVLPTGLVLGVLYGINALDLPTAAVLVAGGLTIWWWRDRSRAVRLQCLGWAGLVAATAAAVVMPFAAGFGPPTAGIGVVTAHPPPGRFGADLVLVHGVALWVLLAALIGRLATPGNRLLAWGAAVVIGVVLLAPTGFAGAFALLGAVAVAVLAALDARLPAADRAFWLLVAGAFGLLALPELVYVRDAFDGTENFRFNTVFKLWYQAWYLLAVAAGYALVNATRWLRPVPLAVWGAGVVVLVAAGAAYPLAAPAARTGGFAASPTLDGARWLPPDDAAAISWLSRHADRPAVVAEAVGEDYSDSARVSTFTGLPAVLGWAGHEIQWGHDPGTRAEDVALLYETTDPEVARAVVERYGVRYVFVGSLEREQYDLAGLAVLGQLGPVAFRSGDTVIYDVGGTNGALGQT